MTYKKPSPELKMIHANFVWKKILMMMLFIQKQLISS